MSDILKSIQLPFSYCQADLFSPIFAYNSSNPSKHWVLVVHCVSWHGVHLDSYSAQSISRGFQRTFALQGIPRVIWIDAGLNKVKSGKDLMQSEVKVVSELNLKFSEIKFKVTLPKHHEGIGAVECVIGVIKNIVSKSIAGPEPCQDGQGGAAHLAKPGNPENQRQAAHPRTETSSQHWRFF